MVPPFRKTRCAVSCNSASTSSISFLPLMACLSSDSKIGNNICASSRVKVRLDICFYSTGIGRESRLRSTPGIGLIDVLINVDGNQRRLGRRGDLGKNDQALGARAANLHGQLLQTQSHDRDKDDHAAAATPAGA